MTVADRIELLKNAFQSEAELDLVLSKLFDAALARQRQQLTEYDRELQEFEQRYGMDSSTFQGEFESGALGDGMDFFEWNGLYELRQRVAEKIRSLELAE